MLKIGYLKRTVILCLNESEEKYSRIGTWQFTSRSPIHNATLDR